MKFSKLGRTAIVAVAGALLLSSCASNEPAGPAGDPSGDAGETSAPAAELSGSLAGAGASSMGAAQEAWIAGFGTINGDVNVTYDPIGSGGGREQFIGGGTAFAGSDAYLDDEELAGEFAACAPDTLPVDLPLYISPIAVIFNIEGVDSLNMDAATIAGIFAGEITKWNAEEIASQNEGVELPDADITAVHRADKSGTTENFTQYLTANAEDIWTAGEIEEWPAEYGGEGANQTSGMVDTVRNGQNTIGYADASRADTLGTVSLKVGEEYVPFTAEAAAAAVDASKPVADRHDGDLAIDLDRTTTAAGVYPLVLIAYSIACTEYKDAEQGELVKAYLSYVASEEGQAASSENAGSAPISEDLRSQVVPTIEAIK